MRIMIFGGAGCLGSNLIEHWIPKGYEIIVFDNFVTGKRELVPSMANLRLIEASVDDSVAVDRAIKEHSPTIVINAAASYKDPRDWSQDILTNVIGASNIAKTSEQSGVKKMINFQTALCYGRPSVTPIPVEHSLSPFTSYGISKTAGEAFMLMSDMPTLSIRIANVTGPRLAIGPIPTFYKRLKAGQECFCSDSERDFLDMSDFLRFMDIAILEESPCGVFNVSSGVPHSVKQVFDRVCSHLGLTDVTAPIVPVATDDIKTVTLDPKKTITEFGWEPRITFDELMERQLRWYDQHGVSEVFSHLKSVTSPDFQD